MGRTAGTCMPLLHIRPFSCSLMSYGWLTESSLIPKPGKPIENVSGSSLAPLRALALQKQEEAQKRKLESGLTVTKPTKKFRSRMEQRCSEVNEGVAERDAKDAEEQAEALQTFERSRKRLEQKAKLYDALASGVITSQDVTNAVGVAGNRSTFKGKAAALCLDIEAKASESLGSYVNADTVAAGDVQTSRKESVEKSHQDLLRSRLEVLKEQRRQQQQQQRGKKSSHHSSPAQQPNPPPHGEQSSSNKKTRDMTDKPSVILSSVSYETNC